MSRRNLLFASLLIYGSATAQGPYAPAVANSGTTAMHKDSSAFIGWAFGCSVDRGYMDINDKGLGFVSAGTDLNATGAPDGLTVSLGDSGVATLSFIHPIVDGPGYDFAVFENSFSDAFLELAQVSVSSNGVDFVTFPAHSITADTANIGGFGSVDATNINNLAGKYRAQYGTPFDLAELPASAVLDINNITEVRLVDVTGTVDSNFAIVDTAGNKIVDPYPTPFATGGFDLDAVGVINATAAVGLSEYTLRVNVYPNPATDLIRIQGVSNTSSYHIVDISGKIVMTGVLDPNGILDVQDIRSGLYVLIVNNASKTAQTTFVKR